MIRSIVIYEAAHILQKNKSMSDNNAVLVLVKWLLKGILASVKSTLSDSWNLGFSVIGVIASFPNILWWTFPRHKSIRERKVFVKKADFSSTDVFSRLPLARVAEVGGWARGEGWRCWTSLLKSGLSPLD